MKINSSKKGLGVADLQAIGISFVVIAITLGLGATLLGSIQQNNCTWNASETRCVPATTTVASNVTGYGLSGIATLGQWLPTIALVVVIAVIIGIIMLYLAKQAQ